MTDQPSDVLPLAVDAAELAELLRVSPMTIRRMEEDGKLPRAIKWSAKLKRWAVDEIRAWLAAGSPDRDRWERMKRAERAG